MSTSTSSKSRSKKPSASNFLENYFSLQQHSNPLSGTMYDASLRMNKLEFTLKRTNSKLIQLKQQKSEQHS
jgi:hypothetical protein